MPYDGAGPVAAMAVVWAWSALTSLAPALTLSVLAQMPALTCTERAMMSV